MPKITIELPEDVHRSLLKQSENIGVSPDVAAKLVLISYLTQKGGRLWLGEWHGGGKGAKRIVVQWPYVTGYFEAKAEDLV